MGGWQRGESTAGVAWVAAGMGETAAALLPELERLASDCAITSKRCAGDKSAALPAGCDVFLPVGAVFGLGAQPGVVSEKCFNKAGIAPTIVAVVDPHLQVNFLGNGAIQFPEAINRFVFAAGHLFLDVPLLGEQLRLLPLGQGDDAVAFLRLPSLATCQLAALLAAHIRGEQPPAASRCFCENFADVHFASRTPPRGFTRATALSMCQLRQFVI